jgi:hypothetical protein
MNLLDHFHGELYAWRHWHSFHTGWAYNIAADLNRALPERWFAESNVQFGIEIDVATFERAQAGTESPAFSAVVPLTGNTYNPPAPRWQTPFEPASDTVEIVIYNDEAGPLLVGAIELVSPANKDRPAHRAAFVTKCASLLRQGTGLVIVDVVTDRLANLHNELMAQLGLEFHLPDALYATAYRLAEVAAQPQLQIWSESLAVGQPLPTLPLWLRGEYCLPIDLAQSYEKTCLEQKITADRFQAPAQKAS